MLYDPYAIETIENPYPVYQWLRDEEPVHRIEKLDYWVLSRYDDVLAALKDTETFSSERWLFLEQDPDIFFPSLQSIDPPRHNLLRTLILEGFTGRRVAALEKRMRGIVRELMDEFIERGTCDLSDELAWPFPATVICELLGVPREDHPLFRRWSYDLATGPRRGDDSSPKAVAAIYSYFGDMVRERRKHPGSDMVSDLLRVRIDGEGLSFEELQGFCFLLLVAGHETTTNLLGNIFGLLCERPDVRTELAGDRSLLGAAVEEFLRFESPTQGLSRTVMRDVELHGTKMREGERVHLLFASANRDERQFDAPETLDIRRSPNPHLAFGFGVHYCLGAKLARQEAIVALDEILDRMPDFELTGAPPQRLHSALLRGVESFPVQFTPPG